MKLSLIIVVFGVFKTSGGCSSRLKQFAHMSHADISSNNNNPEPAGKVLNAGYRKAKKNSRQRGGEGSEYSPLSYCEHMI
jgi:hypothetical protein